MKVAAELGDQAVFDRLTAFVGIEMAFGHVGRVLGSVDEYVIPRHLLWRSRSGHLLIPLVGSLKRRIDIEDDAPVVELLVMDELADEELCRLHDANSIAQSVLFGGITLAARGKSTALPRDRCGGRIARHDERKYWAYLTEEQRHEAECRAGRMQRDVYHGPLGVIACAIDGRVDQ